MGSIINGSRSPTTVPSLTVVGDVQVAGVLTAAGAVEVAGVLTASGGLAGVDVGMIDDETLYEVNLSTLATQDFVAGGDGNYVIDGKTWAVSQTANASEFGLVNGTGLRFNAAALATTDLSSSTSTAPRMTINIATLLGSSWDALRSYLFEFYLSSSTMPTTSDRVLMGMWWSATAFLAGGKRNSSGTIQASVHSQTAAQGRTVTTENVYSLKIDSRGAAIQAGAWAGGATPWPSRYVSAKAAVTRVDSTPSQSMHFDTETGPALLVVAFPSNIAGTHDATLERFRIRRAAA